MCIRCSVCEQKDEQKEQTEQMDDFNSNLRGFRSNQSISDMNTIHMDRVIMLFDRRNQKIDEKTKSVNLH